MNTTAIVLAIISAANWGLVDICKFDLVAWIFGRQAVGFSASSTRSWIWLACGTSLYCSRRT